MSKKVVHLADDAHDVAKQYCKERGVKMSDWVAVLIREATSQRAASPQSAHAPVVASPAPMAAPQAPAPAASNSNDEAARHAAKKKAPLRADPRPQADENGVPVYSQPPFWSRAKG